MIELIKQFFPDGSIPKDIKLLTWATTIRWIGWGFGESLIPVFIFTFGHTYAETGLLSSVYNITFVLMIPFVGLLADKIPARAILIIGLIIYPFIGFSYFWAGVTGGAFFIVIARFLNGIGYAFDSVGRSTYFRRHSPHEKISSALGYFDSVTTLFWILAVLSSILLIRYFSITQLLLAIVPTSLIALGMVFYLNKDLAGTVRDGVRSMFREKVFYSIWNEVRGWSGGLRLISFIRFFLGFVGVVSGFFIPINVYLEGNSLVQVILIGAISAAPSIFSIYIGRIADKFRKASVFGGVATIVILCFLLAIFDGNYWIQFVIAFGFGLAINLTYFAIEGIATESINKEHYGRMGSLLSDSGSIGGLVAPIILGVLIDNHGTQVSFMILGVFTFIVFVLLFAERKIMKG